MLEIIGVVAGVVGAIDILDKRLGKDHPKTVLVRRNLERLKG